MRLSSATRSPTCGEHDRVAPSDGLSHVLARIEIRTTDDLLAVAADVRQHLAPEIDTYDRHLVTIGTGLDIGLHDTRAAFEHIQETPYRFEDPSELSCAPNRAAPTSHCS